VQDPVIEGDGNVVTTTAIAPSIGEENYGKPRRKLA
jgi:hypothetical protein